MNRTIAEVFTIDKEHWVGTSFRVRNYFPEGRNLLDRFTPFVLLDYNSKKDFPPSKSPKGVSAHPHRGLETVTFCLEGAVEHHDNAGNHGIIYPGDVQWMTAGKGIMHREYHEEAYRLKGGPFHAIQLWIGLPKEDKYTEPGYQAISKDDMPKIDLDQGATVTLVAGNFQGIQGPAHTYSPMNVYFIESEKKASFTIQEPSTYNLGFLIIDGSYLINGQEVQTNDFVLFNHEEGDIKIETLEAGRIFVLSGEPLEDPQFVAGPFAMNSQEELDQANQDWRAGNFGTEDF